MKKIMTIALAAAMLAACSEDVLEERVSEKNEAAAKSLLQVRTRGSDDATVSYPVQVYVFQGEGSGGSDAECRAVQTLGDAGQTLNIALTEGTYSVYAVGGAGSDDYTLPTKDDATPSTVIALKEGRALTDLMSATATATLTDGGSNTVTLGLQRKTMLIQDITISKIPTAATAVSVTIAPLWQSLTVGGTYSTAGQTTTIALTKQEDNRTWKNTNPAPDPSPTGAGSEGSGDSSAGSEDTSGPGSVFLLPPSSQPASISVNITIDGTTKTYTYSTSDQLEAGYKITIDGTYTEAVGVNLTGTITGATWHGERTISFTFDESGSAAAGTGGGDNGGGSDNGTGAGNDDTPGSGNEGGDGPGTGNNPGTGNGDDPGSGTSGVIPAVGDTYQGCYVLAVTDADDHADVLLLAATELTGAFYGNSAQSAVNDALATLVDGGISGWDVPDVDEARLIFNARGSIGGIGHDSYLCENGGYKRFRLGVSSFSATTPPSSSTDTALRAVATVSIAKE